MYSAYASFGVIGVGSRRAQNRSRNSRFAPTASPSYSSRSHASAMYFDTSKMLSSAAASSPANRPAATSRVAPRTTNARSTVMVVSGNAILKPIRYSPGNSPSSGTFIVSTPPAAW